jgi:hypothetical protein
MLAAMSTLRSRLTRPVITELVLAAIWLGCIGLLAIGASGLVAWALGSIAGKGFVAGDAPGVAYTAARCRDFLEYAPHARTCADAATTHHFTEVVWYRIVAGALGAVGLLVWRWVRRRSGPSTLRPESFVPTVGCALFGAAAIGLLAQGADLWWQKTSGGGGALLSGGIVAAVFAAWFAKEALAGITVQPSATKPRPSAAL